MLKFYAHFFRYLSGAGHGSELLHQLIEQLVFSFGLWARVHTKVSFSPTLLFLLG